MNLALSCILGLIGIFDLLPLHDMGSPHGLSELESIQGGEFGGAIIDLGSGEVIARTGEGLYPLESLRPVLTAYAASVMAGGVEPFLPTDEDSSLATRILSHPFLDGAPGDIQLSPQDSLLVSDWMELMAFDVSLWSDSAGGEILVSLDDAIIIAESMHAGLGNNAIHGLLEEPELGEGQASSVGEGFPLFGIIDQGTDHRSFFLLSLSGDESHLGLVLLNRDLCCPGKADLALMLMWTSSGS